jgi:hypothetical protein
LFAFGLVASCSDSGLSGGTGSTPQPAKSGDKSTSGGNPGKSTGSTGGTGNTGGTGGTGTSGNTGNTAGGNTANTAGGNTANTAGNTAGGNTAGGNPGIGTSDGSDSIVPDLVDLPLVITANQGKAAGTNCVFIAINPDATTPTDFPADFQQGSQVAGLTRLGCESGAANTNDFAPVSVKVHARPYCNVIRVMNRLIEPPNVISTTKANSVRFGENASLVGLLGMRVYQRSPLLVFDINDNGDQKEDIDLNFNIQGLEAVDFTVEGSGTGCTPK